jgi:hypothetical protein
MNLLKALLTNRSAELFLHFKKESPCNPPNGTYEVIILNTYKVLKTDVEFFAAALFQARVYVIYPLSEDIMEIVDYGGLVEKYTSHSVRINGSYFLRDSIGI